MLTRLSRGVTTSPPTQPLAAAHGPTSGAATAGLDDLSLHPPGAGEGGVAGAAPSPAPRSVGGGVAAAAPDASPAAPSVGDDAPGGAALVAGRPPSVPRVGGGASSSSPDSGPPELFDDEGVALLAEAAASPFSPPATERHAAFLKLTDSAAKASLMRREQRCADFSALAAESGVPLFGDDRTGQARALVNQSNEEAKRGPADFAEAGALLRRAWVVLVSLSLPVLQRRIAQDTLLPGKCRPEEEASFMYDQQLIFRVIEQPEQSAAALKQVAACVGYSAALNAAHAALNLLQLHLGNADQRGRAQAFVLSVLGLIPHTAGLTVRLPSEFELVAIIDNNRDPSSYHPDFWASLQALWRSPAVADVLLPRGALQGGAAAAAALKTEFKARQAADLAKKGLRACALPSCGKQETTVLQFRVYGHCQRGVRYCCPEHAKQHWPAHKREEEQSGGGAM